MKKQAQVQGTGMSWMGLFVLSLLMSVPFYYLMHRINTTLEEIARK